MGHIDDVLTYESVEAWLLGIIATYGADATVGYGQFGGSCPLAQRLHAAGYTNVYVAAFEVEDQGTGKILASLPDYAEEFVQSIDGWFAPGEAIPAGHALQILQETNAIP